MAAVAKRTTAQACKDKGNEAFKKGNFQEAVEHYTSAIKADPSDHVLPCNRAFARMKLKQWKLAETDCTRSLELLPAPNCKALFRRGTARRQLNKWTEALQDLKDAFALEPNNTSISAELDAVKSHLQQESAKNATISVPAEVPLASSAATSDSETSSATPPTAGPSSSAAHTDRRSSTGSSSGLLREVSTTRFASSAAPKSSAGPGTSFGALKQMRQRKEEQSSGYLGNRNPHPLVTSSPAHIPKLDAKASKKPYQGPSVSMPPVKNFSDFEMRWGMSSDPEIRCLVLEALDYRHVAEMFGEHLDPGTLEEIIDALEVSLKSNEQARIRKAVELLKGMDNVSRIETLTMFLEPKHQKVIRELLVKSQSFEGGESVTLSNWRL
ncbi:hypothetical protein PCANC_06319 [Puccinia coronata f. sp. avenae]|uniref:RNA polymerase II-associated protein 3 n=1 Tax=Puccinia coronata f. sp. avenae TaxID=200324 RepID=A0A2N5T1S8_9BASI|nr:hypothetical protein PCANC_06319 [Puccinia coronata f. sp. avenae]